MLYSDENHAAALGKWAVESRALDSWLERSLGKDWFEIKSAWGLGNIDDQDHRLWRWVLVTRCTATVLLDTAKDDKDVFIRKLAQKPDLLEIQPSFLSRTIEFVPNCYAIEDCLKLIMHPETTGLHISGISRMSIEQGQVGKYETALDLIQEVDPVSIEMISRFCQAISPVQTKPTLKEGLCISSSSREIPGLIFISEAPKILLAESIIHETSHLCMSAYEKIRELYLDKGEAFVSSPLRTDPRPIRGLMHQIWVLINLSRFYRAVQNSQDRQVLQNKSKIRKRLSIHEKDLRFGVNSALSNRMLLNYQGNILLDNFVILSESND